MTTIVTANGFGGPDQLVLSGTDRPEPGAGEVLIEVRAAGVNPIDLKVYSGLMGADPANLPLHLGFEAAGVVTAVGADAIGPAGPVSVGDEVIAFRISGGYATDVVVPATAVVPKPAALGWAEAGGLMLTGATAVHLLTATAVTDADTVLIHGGSGGVGLMAIQLAVQRGARVIATASPRRHDALAALGAEPVAYGDGLLDRLRALVPAPSSGSARRGFDAALDLVGTDEALATSLDLVADRSRIATIANFAAGPAAGIKVLGGGPGADPGTELRANARTGLAELAGDGSLVVHVGATFALADVADAHRLVAAGKADGKVVLVP